MTVLADRVEEELVDVEQRVSPLELFFDLVFVFAITQVTGFIAHDATWTSESEFTKPLRGRPPTRGTPTD